MSEPYRICSRDISFPPRPPMGIVSISLRVTSTTKLKAHYDDQYPPTASEEDGRNHHLLGRAAAELVPLTIFDNIDFDRLSSIVFAFGPPMPTNEAMKEGLSRALSYYPHLAGRLQTCLHSRPRLLLNNAGMRLVEASSPVSLEDILPLDPSAVANTDDLVPPLQFSGVEEEQELLYVQLNRFACGGIVLGIAADHRVSDGHSLGLFVDSWARLVRGLELDRLPFHDRGAVSAARSPLQCLFDHGQIEFKEIPLPPPSRVRQVVVRFTSDLITQLKGKVAGDGGVRCSTFLCLTTHMWKKMTLARGLDDDRLTHVRIAVDGRSRLKPPIPREYFGNLVLWATPRLTAREVLDWSYTQVAGVIRRAVAEMDDGYFKSFVDYGEILRSAGKEGSAIHVPNGDVMCPNLEVNSLLNAGFEKVDFGGGPPSALLMPPGEAIEGLLFFLPSCSCSGDVDVFAGLMPHQVDSFMHSVFNVDGESGSPLLP